MVVGPREAVNIHSVKAKTIFIIFLLLVFGLFAFASNQAKEAKIKNVRIAQETGTIRIKKGYLRLFDDNSSVIKLNNIEFISKGNIGSTLIIGDRTYYYSVSTQRDEDYQLITYFITHKR